MASRLSHIHERIRHHGRRAAEHVRGIFSKKAIPTEIVDDEEIGFNSSAVKAPVLSRIKLLRFRNAEDFDEVRTLLQKYDLILINVTAFQNVDELKRGLGRVKLLPARGIKCSLAGLDTNWVVIISENIELAA